MRIGVNTRLFVKGKMDGIAWYAYEVLRRMVMSHPEHEFVFFFDRPYLEEFVFEKNVKPVVLHPQARHPLLWRYFFEVSLKRALVREKVDLFFSPEGFVCLSSKVPTVNIIHDINFEHFPEFLQKSHRRYYQKYFPLYAQRSDTLTTVSEFCKQDIAETYQLPADKIEVAGNAAAEDFFPLSEAERQAVRNEWTEGKPFFVFVGTINRRKNVIHQLMAYDDFREAGHEAKFVFVGSKKHWNSEMGHCLQNMRHASDVVFTNYISTTDLNRILASACALMYVSSFEGFGVPILEAFAAETPVITASVTAMPEVAGDAALLVHPDDVPGISAAMQRVFTDMELRGRLVEKGRLRQRSFSWDSTADILWRIIEKQYYSSNLNHDEKQ